MGATMPNPPAPPAARMGMPGLVMPMCAAGVAVVFIPAPAMNCVG